MATSGVGTVLFKKGQAGSGSENELWDDTALIKAYDNAVKLMKSKIKSENGKEEEAVPETFQQKKKKKNKKKRSKSKKRKWSPGDQCRAVFSEDGLIYDAEILSVDEETSTCFVRYKGYGNEEEHNLSDLLLSTGRQRKQKLASDVETDSMDWSDRPSPAPKSNRRGQKPGQPSSIPNNTFSWPGSSMFPPFQGMAPPQIPFSSLPTYPGFPPSGFPHPAGLPTVPPPPPPIGDDLMEGDNEALCSMLMSWYMSGYHTGYYQGLRHARQSGASTASQSESGR
ncbi:survival motor neuron protein 1-like [Pecten maximus]|uniref:survival motor neuron protein 1-like n=1 Tax=Pecten maximus TaxID=6579 RepID=UPI0014589C55|nr:survival motor neuron protein 1-like [Pecten maximus]